MWYLSDAKCKWFAYGLADATATPSFLASLKSRMVLPFWCQLTQVVSENRTLNGCRIVTVQCGHTVQPPSEWEDRQTDGQTDGSQHCFMPCLPLSWWLGGAVVRALDSWLRVQSPAMPLSGNNSGQVVHTHVPLSPSSIIWYRPNRRGVNGHTVRCTSPVPWPCSVSWCLTEGLMKQRSAPPYGPYGLGKDFNFTFTNSSIIRYKWNVWISNSVR